MRILLILLAIFGMSETFAKGKMLSKCTGAYCDVQPSEELGFDTSLTRNGAVIHLSGRVFVNHSRITEGMFDRFNAVHKRLVEDGYRPSESPAERDVESFKVCSIDVGKDIRGDRYTEIRCGKSSLLVDHSEFRIGDYEKEVKIFLDIAAISEWVLTR